MINIINITDKNQIHFTTNKDKFNVKLLVKDNNYEGTIYKTNFSEIKNGVTYFIILSSVIVPSLKDPFLQFEYENQKIKIPFKFVSTELKNFSLIGNSCLCWRVYERFNIPYNSPTIGNLILDDYEYLRFCEHIETYLKTPVTIGDTKGNEGFRDITGHRRVNEVDDKVIKNYPITHHNDIEIHWIHGQERFLTFSEGTYKENHGKIIPKHSFIDKWNRRVERGYNTEKICLWSSSEFFNVHGLWRRKNIIERFKKLPNKSILLTEIKEEEFEDDNHIIKYIPEWEGRHQLERNEVGGLLWNEQLKNSEIMFNIIKSKFL